MMLVLGQDNTVGPFVADLAGWCWIPGMGRTIGVVDGGVLIAGIAYESWNGANILMHCSGLNSRWISKKLLWMAFDYPFNQLGCKRVTAVTASANKEARRLDEHLGFKLEATLKNAHPQGDLLVYAMQKEDCRWLKLRERYVRPSDVVPFDATPVGGDVQRAGASSRSYTAG